MSSELLAEEPEAVVQMPASVVVLKSMAMIPVMTMENATRYYMSDDGLSDALVVVMMVVTMGVVVVVMMAQ